MKIIETERLILRTWKEEDTVPLININKDPKVGEFFKKTLTAEETLERLEDITNHLKEHNFGLWATELKQTGEFIGYIGINKPSFEAHFMPCISIGWRLASEHWGKGYAPEGAKAALQYGFDNIPDLNEIVAFTAALNKRSQRVMEKIGMKRDINGDFVALTIPLDHPLSPRYLYRIQRPAKK